MKVPYRIVIIILIGVVFVSFGTTLCAEGNLPRFGVSIPSANQEAAFVWNLLKNISFYDSNRYVLSLPQSEIILIMLQKARGNKLLGEDWNLLQKDFEATIYNQVDYQKGYKAISDVLDIADSKVAIFQHYHEKWSFYLPSQYNVQLTLYGPGGSYDPRTGTIVIMTTKEGAFKRGNNPLETMLHEAIHIGIENTIVSKYGLSHWTKERIVDQFMVRHFKNVCPNYRMQPNAETSIDVIFQDEDVWDNLTERVRQFVSH